MAIIIPDLSGSNLLLDSESYLTDLSSTDLNLRGGLTPSSDTTWETTVQLSDPDYPNMPWVDAPIGPRNDTHYA